VTRAAAVGAGILRLLLVAVWARDLISCGIIISDLTLRFMDRLAL